MGLYEFFRYNLAWMASVAVLWPLNIPLAFLAYKIRQGHTPIEMERGELWFRSTLVSFGVAVATVVAIGLDWFLTEADLPTGIVHLVIFLAYVGAGWYLFFWLFGLDEPFEGLSSLLLYLYIPIVVLYLVNKITGLWEIPLGWALHWLRP